MLTIGNIIEKEDSHSTPFKVLWNDIEIDDEKVSAYSIGGENIYVNLYGNVIKLCDLSTEVISSNICELELNYFEHINSDVHCIELSFESHYKTTGIQYQLYFDFETWNFPWSILEFANELIEYFENRQELELKIVREDDDFVSNGLHFQRVGIPSGPFNLFVDEDLLVIDRILSDVREALIAKVRPGALVTWFDFPDHIKNSCEQYLVYFSEFLKDIGLSVNSEISEIGTKVLFSVVPKNKDDAIDKIRQALNIYLQFPSFDYSNQLGSADEDIYIQKLRAQIFHLQSQIILNNAASNALEKSVSNQDQPEMLLDSVEYSVIEGKREEKEEIFGGLISIKKYQGKGFEIDLPAIVRMLKGNNS